MVFIDQLKKEHEVFKELLNEFGGLKNNTSASLDEVGQTFKKLDALWSVHEKKEEDNFARITVVDVSKFFEKVVEDHKKFKPYRDFVREAFETNDLEKVREVLERNFDWIKDNLLDHFTYEESYLFTKIESYSDEELGFVTN